MATHGLPSTYKSGCRCEACRAANAIYCGEQRAKRSQRPTADIPHGAGGYQNWGCRCDVCRSAATEVRAAYRTQKLGGES